MHLLMLSVAQVREPLYGCQDPKHCIALCLHDRLRLRGIGLDLQTSPAACCRRHHLQSDSRQCAFCFAVDQCQLGLAHTLTSDAGEERDLEVRGLFYGIGHTPNSHLVEGQIELDDKGYVKVSVSITNGSCEPL